MVFLRVIGADDADAAQPFPDQIVLLVALAVGDLPEVLDPLAEEYARSEEQRHDADDHEREVNILAHAENDAAEKHQRDNEDAAAEHGDHLVERAHVMGGTGDQIGGAYAAHLRQGHGMDPAEEGGAQIPGIAGDDVIDHPVAPGHGAQAQQREPQHPACGFEDVAEGVGLRRAVNALVQHVGHQRRQQQIADRRNSHQERGQGDPAPVGFEIRQ